LARFKSIDPQRISTISAKTESIRKRVEELTQRNLASVLVDVTPSGVETAIDCIYSLEPGGRVALIGNNTETLAVPYIYLMIRSIEFTSCHSRNYKDVHELVELTRHGAIDVSMCVRSISTLKLSTMVWIGSTSEQLEICPSGR